MTLYSFDGCTPQVDESAWIAPDANVIGDVILGVKTGIWFGATLRGDNEAIIVGDGSNIQENCVLHTDLGFPLTIGRNCTIGHKAMLHGCVIGDGSLIGMGATILNGVTIGKNCQIAAGALIPEGKTIPEGSLVMGVPGKVVRALDTDRIASLQKSAEDYQIRAAEFLASFKPLQ